MPSSPSPSNVPSHLEVPPDFIAWKDSQFHELPSITHEPVAKHQHTFIMLHGRGSSAEAFASALLSYTTSRQETLQKAFPHAKLIFPTAPQDQSAIFWRSRPKDASPILIRQWYDDWFPDPSSKWQAAEQESYALKGLYASSLYFHEILEHEIKLVGKSNVVLWGARQGCVVALSTLMTWEKEPFAAVIGMGGYLPLDGNVWNYANGVVSDLLADEWWDMDTYWEKENEDDEDYDWPTKAVMYFRFELFLQDKKGEVFKEVPIFLGQCEKSVSAERGRAAKNCLDIIGADLKWKEYKSLPSAHGYCTEMLDDIFEFLREKLEVKRPGVRKSDSQAQKPEEDVAKLEISDHHCIM